MRPTRLTLVHTAIAALAAIGSVRALHQTALVGTIVDEPARAAVLIALPIVSAAASIVSIVLGMNGGTALRALRSDVGGLLVFAAGIAVLALGRETREVVGILYVGILVARLAPLALAVAAGSARPAMAAFAVSLLFYAPLSIWSGAATYAQGDQPHYLLAADAIAHGSLDVAGAYADPRAFSALAGTPLEGADVDTHLVRAAGGTHPVQGFGLAAVIAPGWAALGKNGALLTLALVAAFASAQLLLLCRETVADPRAAGVAWLVVAGCAPIATAATTIYPNIVGAAAIVVAYRFLFTASVRRPIVAGLAAATTLLLTPRDAAAILLLVPFAFIVGRSFGLRFVATLAAAAVAVSALDLVTYGLPLPYAGYAFGIDAAQRLDGAPTLRLRPDIGLGGILFDRDFGLAGSAPWAFIGLLATGRAIRDRTRALLLPALAAVGGSLVALSFYRLWEGGYAPPNRYLADVLPLWAPFIGWTIASYTGRVRAAFAVVIGLGAIASFLLLAVPNLGFNTYDSARLVETLDRLLIVDPFRLLPSFEDPGALGPAFIRALPFAVATVLLTVLGLRRPRTT